MDAERALGADGTRFTLRELEEMPALGVSRVGFLKLDERSDGGGMRIWLGHVRFGTDGSYSRQVIVERFESERGRWRVVDVYEVG
jgi:hypothetical protein